MDEEEIAAFSLHGDNHDISIEMYEDRVDVSGEFFGHPVSGVMTWSYDGPKAHLRGPQSGMVYHADPGTFDFSSQSIEELPDSRAAEAVRDEMFNGKNMDFAIEVWNKTYLAPAG